MGHNAIAEICINAGTLAASGMLHDFFSKNACRLHDHGIHYTFCKDAIDLPGQRAAYSLINVALASPALLIEHLRATKDALFAEEYKIFPHVLTLSCPSLYRYPNVVTILEKALSTVFPDAHISYFAAFCSQYHEVEALCAMVALTSTRPPEQVAQIYFSIKNMLNYHAGVTAFQQVVGYERLRVHVAPSQELVIGQSALNDFLGYLGIDEDALRTLDTSPSSYLLGQTSWAFARFAADINRYMGLPTSNIPQPWLHLLPQLMPVSGETRPSLLGPVVRKKIYEQYVASNALFCQSLGQAPLEEPAEEPAWKTPHMTSVIAHEFINALDVNFVAALRTKLREMKYPDCIELYYYRQALSKTNSVQYLQNVHENAVDVLTITRDQEMYIADCIESVLAQKTTFPVRHIIVDHASDDGTPETIARYAQLYPEKIVPIFLPTWRKGQNIQTLFSACTAKYAALCDGDDYFTDPNKLQKQVDYLEKQPECSMCFHQVQVVYEDGTNRERLHPPVELMPRGVRPFYYLADLFKTNFIQTNSVMYRWRFKDGLPDWFRSHLIPGDWYWHILHAEMGKIGFMDGIMSVYRRHKQSLYYSSENSVSSVPHRLMHGLKELEAYNVINQHFERHYERSIVGFTNNVLVDFLRHAQTTGDDSFLHKAGEQYPAFMEHFLRDVKSARRSSSSTASCAAKR